MAHSVYLLSPLPQQGGNYCTISRISAHLKSVGYECHIQDPTEFSSKWGFNSINSRGNVGALIGIHALRTGALMKDCGLPYILILGGTDINVLCDDPSAMVVMAEAVNRARYVVCFSQQNQVKALSLWPECSPGKFFVISQAVVTSPSSFCLQKYLNCHYPGLIEHTTNGCKPIVFSFTGGIRPVKNPLFLVSTFQDWHARDSRIIYVVVGPRLDEKFTSDVFEPAIQKRPGVVYLPGLPVEDAHAIISQSFALINTSDSEGMCLAILEAMQLGTPVLARDITGNRALISNGHNGFLFHSPQNFMEKADRLMKSSELRANLIKNAREYVSHNHNLEKEKQAYVGLVKQCLRETNLV